MPDIQMSGECKPSPNSERSSIPDRLDNPRSRRSAEEILDLLQDVAWGRAGTDHLPAIESSVG